MPTSILQTLNAKCCFESFPKISATKISDCKVALTLNMHDQQKILSYKFLAVHIAAHLFSVTTYLWRGNLLNAQCFKGL